MTGWVKNMEKIEENDDESYIRQELKRVRTENNLLKNELERYKDMVKSLKRLLEEN